MSGREPGRQQNAGVPALLATGVSKRFGSNTVLSNVDLRVDSGEIRALLGPNGSGKSTLVKILTGVYEPTNYDVLDVGGRSLVKSGDAHRAGIRVVHQDLGLVNDLSILENVALGSSFFANKVRTIKWKATRRMAKQALGLVGLECDVDTLVGTLAAWERVAVATAAALAGRLETVDLLLLDEVTAALPREEVIRIMDVVRRLASTGVGVLYITHRFEEVFDIAQTYTVLRDGRVLECGNVKDIDEDHLIDLVAGEGSHASARTARASLDEAPERFRCGALNSPRIRNVSFSVKRGEIVAFTGRVGCGKSALGRALFSIEPEANGAFMLDGEAFTPTSPTDLIRLGIGYVSEDRGGSGILRGGTVLENLTSLMLQRFTSRGGIINRRAEARIAGELVEAYDVRPPRIHALIDSLSGGNQQKVVIARWLQLAPRLLILDEPTEGVDAGAREDIYRLVRDETAKGASIILLSSSLEEIVELADRVFVLSEGAISRELRGGSINVEEIEKFLLMSGSRVSQQGEL